MLPTINNFRVLARDRSGKDVFFRSSAIDRASVADAAIIINDLNIRTVVDFRTETENNFSSNEYLRENFSVSAIRIKQTSPTLEFEHKEITNVNASRHVYCLSLFQSKAALVYLKMLPFFQMLYMGFLYLVDKIFNTKYFNKNLMSMVGQFGIRMVYRTMALKSRSEICTVLKLINSGSKWPLLIMCSIGKDRTGMISALLQYIQGCSMEKIQEDYCISEVNLRRDIHIYRKAAIHYKVELEEFIQSPKDLILLFFEVVEEQSGSVKQWLNDGGFTFSEQQELRDKLESFS